MKHKGLMLFILAGGLCTYVLAYGIDKSIYKGDVESRLNTLASIQPGLGVVMHEIGYRAATSYWAANGGNWGLAQYQLKELLEAQEVAEITRPKYTGMLKVFEGNNLTPLEKAIEAKDIKLFNKRFSTAVNACNACHVATGHGFIKYQLPAQSQHEVFDFSLETEPKYEEEKEHK